MLELILTSKGGGGGERQVQYAVEASQGPAGRREGTTGLNKAW